MRLRAAAVLALLWPGLALAQPSFDCAKASTPVERAICGSTKLAAADRELATVYGALAGKAVPKLKLAQRGGSES